MLKNILTWAKCALRMVRFLQKLDKTGVPRWKNSGLRLDTSDYAAHPEVTYSDSIGGAQVVWYQNDEGQNILRFDASRLSTGMYYYVLTGSRTAVSRGLVIVK